MIFSYTGQQCHDTIKIGNIKGSKLHLDNLKEDFKREKLPNSDSITQLSNQVEHLLFFCKWYLQYEETFLKEIFSNTFQPKFQSQQREIEALQKEFQKTNEELKNAQKQVAKKEDEIENLKILSSELRESLFQKEIYEKELQKKLSDTIEHIRAQNEEIVDLSSSIPESLKSLNVQKLNLFITLMNFIKRKQIHLDIPTEDIEGLEHLVNNDTFKLMVIGEFNVGKSTFINALIGEEVLPTKAIPSTAIINILKYGQEKKARLHYRDKGKSPVDIPVEKLSEYITIKNTVGEDNATAEIRNSIFSHAEVWWPLDLLKNNKVEIIDSPGLNETKVREDITLDYLKNVDAIIFIMSAVRFGPAQTEMDSINYLHFFGHTDLFFVVNQWDMLRSNDKAKVKEKALISLPKLTKRKKDIYFVSAMDALEGRVDNNPMLEEISGFNSLEQNLYKYLLQEKNVTQLQRYTTILIKILTATVGAIELKEASFESKKNDLEKTIPMLQRDEKNFTTLLIRSLNSRDDKRVKQDLITVQEELKRISEELNLLQSKINDLEYSKATLDSIKISLESLIDSLKTKEN